jgi:hypothetical protein
MDKSLTSLVVIVPILLGVVAMYSFGESKSNSNSNAPTFFTDMVSKNNKPDGPIKYDLEGGTRRRKTRSKKSRRVRR